MSTWVVFRAESTEQTHHPHSNKQLDARPGPPEGWKSSMGQVSDPDACVLSYSHENKYQLTSVSSVDLQRGRII